MTPRIAELLGGLSLATDLAAGQPPQSALAAAILSSRLTHALQLTETQRQTTFYATLLRFIGCSGAAPEAAALGAGEDTSFNFAFSMCDMADADDIERCLDRYWAPSADPQLRRTVIQGLKEDLSGVAAAAATHCAQAVVLARRLPVPERVVSVLGHMYDRHDGIASSAAGEAIPIEARVSSLAATTAIMLRSLGPRLALDIVLPRAGAEFAPQCCEPLRVEGSTLLAGLEAPSCWETFLDSEPTSPLHSDEHGFDTICTTYGDYGDQKSGYLLGHARKVASLAFLGAEAAGLDLESRQRLRRAALLHDIGRAGVATGIWDKPTELTAHERQLIQAHNTHTETVLSLAPPLRELSQHAGSVHERADRSGYPRASPCDGAAAGLLAAADVYEALTSDRPHRVALSKERAADVLLQEATEGRLPRQAVRAVLDAAGHAKRTGEAAYPAGLSEREVEVLALLAQGQSTKQIAARLGVAPKTAENHVGRIYDKTGARGRAAAALYAVEHGLTAQPPTEG